MTTITTAQADQLHAAVRDARGWDGHASECDALDPCADCKAKTAAVRKARRSGDAPEVPAPRKPSALVARLAAVSA